VDLCAAPGSWSQVLARHVHGGGSAPRAGKTTRKIVAVDLQPMLPLDGVVQLVGDITSAGTRRAILAHFDGLPADLVVCDGAPDVTGLHDIDECVQAQLLAAAVGVTVSLLRRGGSFVAKIFTRGEPDLLVAQLAQLFDTVEIAKPRSSRGTSTEAFVVCLGFNPPHGAPVHPQLAAALGASAGDASAHWERVAVPFLRAGDLSGHDQQ
jgi:tRNA (cytidine32/guanosine34-2'-O)-methyltransferase